MEKRSPTVEQTTQMYRICSSLTQMYLPIYLIRVDERTGDLIILAGEETIAVIDKQGEVDYRE
jgi:hypothetical protein